jgi:hypothetical protein
MAKNLMAALRTWNVISLRGLKVSHDGDGVTYSHDHVHVTAIYGRPRKLCRTYAMRDVSALFESDEDQEEENGSDSDADREESEGEPGDLESTAMMLSDEVSESCLLQYQLYSPQSR